MVSAHPERHDWGVCQWSEEPCSNFVAIKRYGVCNKHYRRLKYLEGRKQGLDLVRAAEVFWGSVDIQSTEKCWPWKGAPHKQGHGTFWWNNVSYHAHTVSYRLVHGEVPSGKIVDHRCRNRICVNPGHLQAATPKENTENLGLYKETESGYRGVTKRENGRWRARVGHNDKVIHVGHFNTPEEAAIAVREARLKMHTNNLADREDTNG